MRPTVSPAIRPIRESFLAPFASAMGVTYVVARPLIVVVTVVKEAEFSTDSVKEFVMGGVNVAESWVVGDGDVGRISLGVGEAKGSSGLFEDEADNSVEDDSGGGVPVPDSDGGGVLSEAGG